MNLKSEEWVPMSMCCPSCGRINIGYKNQEKAVKYECSRCKLVFVRSQKSRRKKMLEIQVRKPS